MTTLTIELDHKVLEEVIRAKTADAVTAVLARYDLQRMIEAVITNEEPKPTTSTPSTPFSILAALSSPPKRSLEDIIKSSILTALENAAKSYLQSHPEIVLQILTSRLPAAVEKLKIKIEEEDDDE